MEETYYYAPLYQWTLKELIQEYAFQREQGTQVLLTDEWLDWYNDVKKELNSRASNMIVERAFERFNNEPGYKEGRMRELGIKNKDEDNKN
jgi:hypothetical protein